MKWTDASTPPPKDAPVLAWGYEQEWDHKTPRGKPRLDYFIAKYRVWMNLPDWTTHHDGIPLCVEKWTKIEGPE